MTTPEEKKAILESILQETINNFTQLKERLNRGEQLDFDKVMIHLGKAALALKKIKGD